MNDALNTQVCKFERESLGNEYQQICIPTSNFSTPRHEQREILSFKGDDGIHFICFLFGFQTQQQFSRILANRN